MSDICCEGQEIMTTRIKWPKNAGSCEEENGIFDEKMTNGKKLNEYKR